MEKRLDVSEERRVELLHSVFVFGMLVQSGLRAEFSTALYACELSLRGRTCASCLHHRT